MLLFEYTYDHVLLWPWTTGRLGYITCEFHIYTLLANLEFLFNTRVLSWPTILESYVLLDMLYYWIFGETSVTLTKVLP